MVINNYKGGRLANRIISFVHLAANSMEHRYKLRNPEFDEFVPYFEATSKNDFNGHPISITLFNNHFLDRAFSRLFRLWADITHKLFRVTPFYRLYRIFKQYEDFDLNDAAFVAHAKSGLVITEGWLFRDRKNVQKHQEEIRQFFTPVKQYRDEVAVVLGEARAVADVVIGVHIRRGDYSRYEGGIWYYEDEVYAEKMQQVQAQYAAEGKTCAFVIAAIENIDRNHFPASLQLFTAQRHFVTDMYCLAACDAIIGPPSTFSLWAAFYGKIPLAYIYKKDDFIQIGCYYNAC